MRVVTYTASAGGKRRMIVFFGTSFLFFLKMTFVAEFRIRVFNKIPRACQGVVTAEATPDKIRTMDKWVGGYLEVT